MLILRFESDDENWPPGLDEVCHVEYPEGTFVLFDTDESSENKSFMKLKYNPLDIFTIQEYINFINDKLCPYTKSCFVLTLRAASRLKIHIPELQIRM